VNAQCGVDRGLGVVGEQRRDLHGHPAVDASSAVEYRPEQIGGAPQVLQRQLDEQLLARQPGLRLAADAGVVCRCIADRLVEDGRVRGEAGDGQFVDVAAQGAVIEDFACDVVEPQALSQIVQAFRDVHGRSSKSDELLSLLPFNMARMSR
jgi:hypothetical protein